MKMSWTRQYSVGWVTGCKWLSQVNSKNQLYTHNVIPDVTFPPWLNLVKICPPGEDNGENTKVSNSLWARGITNKQKQSALSKARSLKHSKTTNSFFVFNLQCITNARVKLISFTWEGSISRILILAVPFNSEYHPFSGWSGSINASLPMTLFK